MQCASFFFQTDGSMPFRVLGDQGFWVFSPRIFTITPGSEHQEISGHQPCRHKDGGKLLQLFNLHPRILTLLCVEFRSRSRSMKLAEQR